MANPAISKLRGLGPNAKEFTFNLLDPQAAWEAQGNTLHADLGLYDPYANSCVTYCVGILRAGGVDIPPGVRGMLYLKKMYESISLIGLPRACPTASNSETAALR
jgi:hypothetical protein